MNRKRSAALFSLVLSVFLSSGCAGPRDLATEPSALPAKEKSIARRISEKAASNCSIGPRHRANDPSPTSGHGMPFRKPPVIIKLFSSTNSSFFRAEAVIDGAWDSIYFDSKNEQIVCGEQNWLAIKGAVNVIFREVPTELEARAAQPQAISTANDQSVVLPNPPATMRHEEIAPKEPKQIIDNTPPSSRPTPSYLPKPSIDNRELVDPTTRTSQRSSASHEERGKCVIKPVMTDEEIARCK